MACIPCIPCILLGVCILCIFLWAHWVFHVSFFYQAKGSTNQKKYTKDTRDTRHLGILAGSPRISSKSNHLDLRSGLGGFGFWVWLCMFFFLRKKELKNSKGGGGVPSPYCNIYNFPNKMRHCKDLAAATDPPF